jgi:hypothetical protein
MERANREAEGYERPLRALRGRPLTVDRPSGRVPRPVAGLTEGQQGLNESWLANSSVWRPKPNEQRAQPARQPKWELDCTGTRLRVNAATKSSWPSSPRQSPEQPAPRLHSRRQRSRYQTTPEWQFWMAQYQISSRPGWDSDQEMHLATAILLSISGLRGRD